jgi:signal recognition particle subunit SRP72
MSDPAATLASLLRASTIQDHKEVLKLANAAVKASKTNLDAHHTRVVALLKLDRFDDALRAIAEGGRALESRCILEKAYALYKSGQLQEARETADKATSTQAASRPFRHLRAQIAYRAESFQDAAAIYHDLAREKAALHGDENDIKINLLATNAQLEYAGLGHQMDDSERQPSRADLEAFETAYNAACAHIARTEFSKASVLLKRAKDLCEASEELSAGEKKAELLPIMIQHIYVLSQLGKNSEAAALQKLVVQSEYVTISAFPTQVHCLTIFFRIPEAPTRVVAQNNEVALATGEGNPYLTQRVAELADRLSGNERLFKYQQSVLERNKYALDLQMQKFRGVELSTNSQILSASEPLALLEVAHLGVISAAGRTHMGKDKAAIQRILAVLERRPNDIGLLLTIIQLHIQMRNPGPAVTILEKFLKRLETTNTRLNADVRFAPGLVAAVVALYRLQGRQSSIRAELTKASAYWRNRLDGPSTSLLREAGVELLRSYNPDDVRVAGATFEKLVAQRGQDITAAAGLVASFATREYTKVEPFLSELAPVERLTAGADVQALVDAGVCSVMATMPVDRKRPTGNELEKDKATKRRRKTRLPKDYEEGKQPDPERWLPLRDRSTYRPKGKKGKKRAQEATQGGVVKEEETLELVGGAGAVKVEKATGGKKKKKGKK